MAHESGEILFRKRKDRVVLEHVHQEWIVQSVEALKGQGHLWRWGRNWMRGQLQGSLQNICVQVCSSEMWRDKQIVLAGQSFFNDTGIVLQSFRLTGVGLKAKISGSFHRCAGCLDNRSSHFAVWCRGFRDLFFRCGVGGNHQICRPGFGKWGQCITTDMWLACGEVDSMMVWSGRGYCGFCSVFYEDVVVAGGVGEEMVVEFFAGRTAYLRNLNWVNFSFLFLFFSI